MKEHVACWIGLLVLSASMTLQAAECPAARAMKDGEKEFNARLETVQRQQWLFLEFLTSDGSKKSNELLAEEYGRNLVRQGQLADLAEEMKKMPGGAPDIPEEGTPACEVSTHAKDTVYKMVDESEAQLNKYYGDGYLFVLGCDLLAVNLLPLGNSVNEPDSKVDPKTLLFMAETALDPLIKSAKLKPADFKKLAGEILQPSQLPARTRYSYTALRCLRINQGVEMAPLAASNQALTKCATSDWVKLGKCVADATQPVKQ